jgi:hypothetical protein
VAVSPGDAGGLKITPVRMCVVADCRLRDLVDIPGQRATLTSTTKTREMMVAIASGRLEDKSLSRGLETGMTFTSSAADILRGH